MSHKWIHVGYLQQQLIELLTILLETDIVLIVLELNVSVDDHSLKEWVTEIEHITSEWPFFQYEHQRQTVLEVEVIQ